MKIIYFVTTNDFKYKSFINKVTLSGVKIEQLKEETPEIQSTDNGTVAKSSAEWAANKFNKPVIKEDVGMYIAALNGFPGVYLNQIEKWIKSEGYLKLLEGITDRTAEWEYAVAYCEPGKNPVSFSAFQKGSISTKVKGTAGYFTDKIFIPEGETETIGELLDSRKYVRNEVHYENLMKHLQSIL
jgi:XTP/dITP diphosphohydrolase